MSFGDFEDHCENCKGCCDGCEHYGTYDGNPAYERDRLGLPFRGNFTPISMGERIAAGVGVSSEPVAGNYLYGSGKPKSKKKSYFRKY